LSWVKRGNGVVAGIQAAGPNRELVLSYGGQVVRIAGFLARLISTEIEELVTACVRGRPAVPAALRIGEEVPE
jgi:hypothetical protein